MRNGLSFCVLKTIALRQMSVKSSASGCAPPYLQKRGGGGRRGRSCARRRRGEAAAEAPLACGSGRGALAGVQLGSHRAEVHRLGDHRAVRGHRLLVDGLGEALQHVERLQLVHRILEAPEAFLRAAAAAAAHLVPPRAAAAAAAAAAHACGRRRRHRPTHGDAAAAARGRPVGLGHRPERAIRALHAHLGPAAPRLLPPAPQRESTPGARERRQRAGATPDEGARGVASVSRVRERQGGRPASADGRRSVQRRRTGRRCAGFPRTRRRASGGRRRAPTRPAARPPGRKASGRAAPTRRARRSRRSARSRRTPSCPPARRASRAPCRCSWGGSGPRSGST